MAKYGSRNVVKEGLENFILGVMGESGVGKTTLFRNVCEKLFGADGYFIANCGKEDGIDCIDNVSYVDVPDAKTFFDFTNDVIKNKKTDYPDLKVIVWDTLDQLFEFMSPYIIKLWNAENAGKKDFTPVKTLNAAFGGFGKGDQLLIEKVLDQLWKLKAVGVQFWYTCHLKQRDIVDAVSNETYTIVTSQMQQNYFNAVKTKTHVLGVAYTDKTIEEKGTGRKNLVTKKEVTVKKVVDESRVIKFRSENYSVDSKSRFANIVDEIPLDADAFIEAIQDAIRNAKGEDKTKKEENPQTKAVESEPEKEETPNFLDNLAAEEGIDIEEDVVEDDIEEEAVDLTQLIVDAKAAYKAADADKKKEIKKVIAKAGAKNFDSLDVESLEEIINL